MGNQRGADSEKKEGLSGEPLSEVQSFQPRLPPFASADTAGLGSAIKRVTSALGIPTCSGCERRADYLNRVLPFRRKS